MVPYAAVMSGSCQACIALWVSIRFLQKQGRPWITTVQLGAALFNFTCRMLPVISTALARLQHRSDAQQPS
jgi:hypothetical protein